MSDTQRQPAARSGRLPGLRQLQPETLPERVAAELTLAILEDGLAPGSALPSLGELAERFAVSRPVIREAVRILATRGLVEVRHGRVPTVAADETRSLLEGLTLSVRRRGGSFRELYEVRRVLETEAAALASQRRTDEDIKRMQAALERMRDRLQVRGEDDIDADIEFHHAVTLAAHNPVLTTVMEPVTALLRMVLRATPAAQPRACGPQQTPEADAWPVWSYEAHREIFDRIDEGDAAGARAAALKHLQFSEARWAAVQEPLDALIARAVAAGLAEPGRQHVPSPLGG